MARRFAFSTNSDPENNWFSEIDVELSYRDGSRLYAANEREIDALQRWMRDAKKGDRRQFGKAEIICIEEHTEEE